MLDFRFFRGLNFIKNKLYHIALNIFENIKKIIFFKKKYFVCLFLLKRLRKWGLLKISHYFLHRFCLFQEHMIRIYNPQPFAYRPTAQLMFKVVLREICLNSKSQSGHQNRFLGVSSFIENDAKT